MAPPKSSGLLVQDEDRSTQQPRPQATCTCLTLTSTHHLGGNARSKSHGEFFQYCKFSIPHHMKKPQLPEEPSNPRH